MPKIAIVSFCSSVDVEIKWLAIFLLDWKNDKGKERWRAKSFIQLHLLMDHWTVLTKRFVKQLETFETIKENRSICHGTIST